VKASPLKLNNKLFILLFLQDKTADQQRSALERTFFHDVNNMLQILVGASELLTSTSTSPLARTILQAALRLQDEIAIQRCLSQDNAVRYKPVLKKISTGDIIGDMQLFFANHPLTQNRKIDFSLCPPENTDFTSDHSLLWRILHNMLLNALEATHDGQEVKVWFEKTDATLTFKVWNIGVIDEKIANRIFERNFTTKNNSGRGLGTYSMKYFGEHILGGKVAFSSAPDLGTTFWFATQIA
jgi:signal transduction histidine kinase